MKKNNKNYIVVWVVLVLMFNLIVFITPNEVAGVSKFHGSFWVGYIFITLTFVAQLLVTLDSLKGNAEKIFYNVPLISVSFVTTIIMLVVGTVCMAVPVIPVWLGVILCAIVLAIAIIIGMQAKATADVVGGIDEKVKNKTFFMKSLRVDVELLQARAENSEIADELKKVWDAVRYSNPVSAEALSGIEAQITIKFADLADAVEKSDIQSVEKASKELQILINDREKKSRLL